MTHMAQRTYGDPVLELMHRTGGDPADVIGLAAEMSDEEAEIGLGTLDAVEAGQRAAEIAGQLRHVGMLW
jgi:hypothetical protein